MYKPGDKSKAICGNCKKLVTTTWGDVTCSGISEDKIIEYLPGYCDKCNTMIVIANSNVIYKDTK